MTAVTIIITVLGITASLALYRVIFGPTPWDRLIAVNLISSKVVDHGRCCSILRTKDISGCGTGIRHYRFRKHNRY